MLIYILRSQVSDPSPYHHLSRFGTLGLKSFKLQVQVFLPVLDLRLQMVCFYLRLLFLGSFAPSALQLLYGSFLSET